MLLGPLAPSVLDQDAAHGLGSSRKEMPATVPGGRLGANQSKIGFVDQGSGLKRLARLLGGQFAGCELPEFLIDEGEKVLGRPRVARGGRVEPLDAYLGKDALDINQILAPRRR